MATRDLKEPITFAIDRYVTRDSKAGKDQNKNQFHIGRHVLWLCGQRFQLNLEMSYNESNLRNVHGEIQRRGKSKLYQYRADH